MCGLVGIGWEARQERANNILSNKEWKQQLCNDLIGLSFRELEHTLTSVANERQKKEDSDNEKVSPGKSQRGKSAGPAKPNRPPPRSLKEILAQVYAAREVPSASRCADREDDILSFYRQAATRSRQDLLSNLDDEHDCPEKSTV